MADGKIVFDTAVDQSGMKDDLREIKGGMGGLKRAVGKIGLAIAAAFSVREITRFGKECIKLGSDLQEVQNVVDVTFTTMSDAVDDFAEKALFTAGLSETMAKQYMGTFGAMSKSFGFTEDSAFEMSKQLTQLAGDVASFYNITQGEAYTKLKSVFTGETETLKDLGVVMTQAALDQYAMAHGMRKTTAQMTEQEKVALRYRFVMDKLSAASGDFIRTSDGWANQTRILSVQFDQLKATIGQGLINALTPVIKVINTIIGRLQALAETFRAFTAKIFGDASASANGGSAAAGMDAAAESADNLADSIGGVGGAAKAAKRELAGFDQLNILGSDAGGKGGGGASGIPDFDIPADSVGVIDQAAEKLERLEKIDFSNLSGSVHYLRDNFKGFVDVIGDHFSWQWENVLKPFGTWSIKEGLPATVGALGGSVGFLAASFETLQGVLEALWPYAEPVLSFFGEEFVLAMENARLSFEKYATALRESKEDIVGIFDEIGSAFGGLWSGTKPILSEMTGFFSWQFQLMRSVAADAFKGIIGIIHGGLMIIDGLMTGDWGKIWGGAKKILSSAIYFMIDLVAEMASSFGVDFDVARSKIIGAINGIIGAINKLISGAVWGINAVTSAISTLSFDIPEWVPIWGGDTFGLNIPQITSYPQIPYLAKGAVIPPSKPFMAVLGDQRHGTNLETPEALLRQIVREEGGGSQVIVSLLREIADLLAQIRDGGDGEVNIRKLARLIGKYQHDAARAGG